jgi:hypothetical protein
MNLATDSPFVQIVAVPFLNIISSYVMSLRWVWLVLSHSYLKNQIRKYIFVNFSNECDLRKFHGKAVALDRNDRHVPFPSLFILHEVRVKADHPFQRMPEDIDLNSIARQDWILSGGVYDEGTGSFKRDAPPRRSGHIQARQPPPEQTMTLGGEPGVGESFMSGVISNDEIAAILAVTRTMPTWRACEMENLGWDGTTEENIKKYVEYVGVEDEDDWGIRIHNRLVRDSQCLEIVSLLELNLERHAWLLGINIIHYYNFNNTTIFMGTCQDECMHSRSFGFRLSNLLVQMWFAPSPFLLPFASYNPAQTNALYVIWKLTA